MVSAEGQPPAYTSRPPRDRLGFVRICAHYFAHAAWLEDEQLIRDAGRLAGIPGALIHGRFDLGAPLTTAWELARVWPDAELTVIGDAGHLGGPATSRAELAALDRFAGKSE